jgi:lipopolysaccharide transport system ATP-binding protein
MYSEPVIRVSNLTKDFHIYDQPLDRLKQYFLPPLQKILGFKPKKYFRCINVLNDLSFQINRGETVGIVGKNGAGKSTLLQVLCGTLSNSAGLVDVHGRVAALLELGSGFSADFTGRENIYINAQLLGLSPDEIESKFAQIAEFADIGDYLDHPVKTYSSGMYVRLAFSVIAHANADILIIDEALAVGDSFFNQKCMRFLHEFKKQGTLIFVTHDPTALNALCSRSLWLDKGHLIADGDTKQICESYLADRYNEKAQVSFVSRLNENSKTTSFGDRRVVIESVYLNNKSNPEVNVFEGNEQVEIRIGMKAHTDIEKIICGFNLKNRWGQVVFGENTLSLTSYAATSNSTFFCSFRFKMPRLGTGLYSIDVAVAEGDSVWHQQLHWIYDAAYVEFSYDRIVTNVLHIDFEHIEISQT